VPYSEWPGMRDMVGMSAVLAASALHVVCTEGVHNSSVRVLQEAMWGFRPRIMHPLLTQQRLLGGWWCPSPMHRIGLLLLLAVLGGHERACHAECSHMQC
jgi:hypothetical protein